MTSRSEALGVGTIEKVLIFINLIFLVLFIGVLLFPSLSIDPCSHVYNSIICSK